MQSGVERPRDRFGRPLPWGSESELPLENYDSLPVEENHRLAMASFDEGVYFAAHEAWEGAWRKARGSADEEFFKGLAQIGAGYTHMQRGNAHGARTLLERGRSRVANYPEGHHGLGLANLIAMLDKHIGVFAADAEARRAATVVATRKLGR